MDIAIIQNSDGGFDIAKNSAGTDLRGDRAGIRNLVYILLFTDRRAEPDDEIPDGTTNRRGWWRDPLLGSRLWLLGRAKETQKTLDRARGYTIEALQRLIDYGIATEIKVLLITWLRPGVMALQVAVIFGDEELYNETVNYYQEAA